MVKDPGPRQFDVDVDALFTLPLAEFTGARNELATRLKKAGHSDEANRVKALAKPSISAWAVNQLYWRHRQAFDQLISTGQRFRKAQNAGKVADIHEALAARREALAHLSNLAMTFLRDVGQNPSPDTERRITTTLEALSVYASLPGGPSSGRLTQDVDPPGFDSLASLMSGTAMPKLTLVPPRAPAAMKPTEASVKIERKKGSAVETRRVEAARQKRIAAAKVSLQRARHSLSEAQAREQRALKAQQKAEAEAKAAEKLRREAELRFEKAKSAAEFANRRATHAATEADKATQSLSEAERAVEKAEVELEALV